MSTPVASLIIPSRGGRARLPVLLSALARQTREDWEAIVVVDGDVDDTEGLLDEVEDPRVRRIVFPENRGRSAALNAGHEAARGRVLIRCDDDLEPSPEYVERHVASHDVDPVGVVGLYLNVYPDNRYAVAYGRPQDVQFREDAYRAPEGVRWRYWAGNVSITRETWERVGPYDTAFRAYGWEDVDWGYRLHAAGVRVLLDPGLETRHHVAATTTRVRALRAYASGAAQERFVAKHGAVLPAGEVRGLWGRATHALGQRVTDRAVGALASTVDRTSEVLPSPIARKAIAFTVEAAAVAGRRRRPEHDVTT